MLQTKGEICLLLLLSKQRVWNESGCWRVSFRRLRKGSAGGGKQGVEGVVVLVWGLELSTWSLQLLSRSGGAGEWGLPPSWAAK